jgi:hypothetical protein
MTGNRTLQVKLKENGTDGEARAFHWDHRNRLTSVEFLNTPSSSSPTRVVQYIYDAYNQQIGRLVHTDGKTSTAPNEERYFVYENGQIVLEFEGDTAADLSQRYLWGPAVDQLLADEQVLAGKLLWPLADQYTFLLFRLHAQARAAGWRQAELGQQAGAGRGRPLADDVSNGLRRATRRVQSPRRGDTSRGLLYKRLQDRPREDSWAHR